MSPWNTCLMDPPWTESGGGKIKRGADRHYPLVPTKKLPALLIGSGEWYPTPNAHLWMWATNNYLPDALWLGEQLGFRYVTNAVWVKTADPKALEQPGDNGLVPASALKLQVGLGQYLRGSHELLLFLVRKGGKGQHESVWNGHRDVPSVIRARRTKHSRKPAESYDLIERVSKGPRLEMFARVARPGWRLWGNEAPS